MRKVGIVEKGKKTGTRKGRRPDDISSQRIGTKPTLTRRPRGTPVLPAAKASSEIVLVEESRLFLSLLVTRQITSQKPVRPNTLLS